VMVCTAWIWCDVRAVGRDLSVCALMDAGARKQLHHGIEVRGGDGREYKVGVDTEAQEAIQPFSLSETGAAL